MPLQNHWKARIKSNLVTPLTHARLHTARCSLSSL